MWSACGAALLRFPAAAASRAPGTPSLRTRISAVHFHHACGNKRPRILARSSFMSTFHPCASLETGAKQLTLSEAVTRTGVGLHSGEMAELRLAPAAAGDGRYFIVGDREHPEDRIPATLDNVQETTLSTCLGDGHYRIRTVEHLLSTLEGLGVGNCRIELRNGTEVPHQRVRVLADPSERTFPQQPKIWRTPSMLSTELAIADSARRIRLFVPEFE